MALVPKQNAWDPNRVTWLGIEVEVKAVALISKQHAGDPNHEMWLGIEVEVRAVPSVMHFPPR
jgi:hypothetical protein